MIPYIHDDTAAQITIFIDSEHLPSSSISTHPKVGNDQQMNVISPDHTQGDEVYQGILKLWF